MHELTLSASHVHGQINLRASHYAQDLDRFIICLKPIGHFYLSTSDALSYRTRRSNTAGLGE
jgi:hypothetical protein